MVLSDKRLKALLGAYDPWLSASGVNIWPKDDGHVGPGARSLTSCVIKVPAAHRRLTLSSHRSSAASENHTHTMATQTQTYTQTYMSDIELEPVCPAYTGGRDKLRNSDPDLFVNQVGWKNGEPVLGNSIPTTPSALSVADALSLSNIDASLGVAGGERVTPMLHPPDKGRHAWQFLAAATMIETSVWGLPVRSTLGRKKTEWIELTLSTQSVSCTRTGTRTCSQRTRVRSPSRRRCRRV